MMHAWIPEFNTPPGKPFLIAGPCSAESPEQLLSVATAIHSMGISVIRAGVWKPRTRPNTFEGKGPEALTWIQDVKKAIGIKVITEVASPVHVEQALKAGLDMLWLGARTTVNPFLVQEIANALRGVKIPVLIKNPVNPDLALWIGAIERMQQTGIEKVGAIHRGFSSFQKSRYRNQPLWQIPIELKRRFPDLLLMGDPSHIAGKREYVEEISQKAMDLGYDGLMIETHPAPEQALSDADQQITPESLKTLLQQLRVSSASSTNAWFINQLETLREKIDHFDQELLEILSARMRVVEKIGEYKKENNVTVFQLERWNEIMKTRPEWGNLNALSPEFVRELYRVIHDESIRIQTDITNQPAQSTQGTEEATDA